MCSMRRSTPASRPANYERRSTGCGDAVSSLATAPTRPAFLAARASPPQLRRGQPAHLVDDFGGAAVAGLDTVAGLRDRHGAQAQSAFGAALARHRHAGPRYRLAIAGGGPELAWGREHWRGHASV